MAIVPGEDAAAAPLTNSLRGTDEGDAAAAPLTNSLRRADEIGVDVGKAISLHAREKTILAISTFAGGPRNRMLAISTFAGGNRDKKTYLLL